MGDVICVFCSGDVINEHHVLIETGIILRIKTRAQNEQFLLSFIVKGRADVLRRN